jgi:lipopolysaccharide assembly outer membrane protein LptD (OstA)
VCSSDLANWTTRGGRMTLAQAASYRINNNTVAGLWLRQGFNIHPDVDPDNQSLMFEFSPRVSYRINPQWSAFFEATINTQNTFESMDFELKPFVEYSLTGPGLLYIEYKLNVEDMTREPSIRHAITLGFNIRAF